MNTLSPFFVCYVFKGQSYLAQQRIDAFIDKIGSDEAVWQKFMNFYKLNKEIQIQDIPILKELITEVFIEKNIPLNA